MSFPRKRESRFGYLHFMNKDKIENLIRLTKIEAAKAIKSGNAPFGALATDKHGKIVVKAYNTVNSDIDPTAHAEINLLRKLAKKLRVVKFKNCLIFINSEPCSMCASAMIRSGIREIYYGADQEGGQILKITLDVIAKNSKEKIKIVKGILKDECREQINNGRKILSKK